MAFPKQNIGASSARSENRPIDAQLPILGDLRRPVQVPIAAALPNA